MTRIEQERRRRGWNQTALAYHARLGQSDVSRIERRLMIPTPRIAERLGRALGVSAEVLLDEVTVETEAAAQ